MALIKDRGEGLNRSSMLPTALLSALFLIPSVAQAAASECPAPLPVAKGNPEFQVSQIAGNAILFPWTAEWGVERATGCLLGWFDRSDFELADLTGTVSDALLAMMTVDPHRFFAAAANASPGQLDEWLSAAIDVSQNQFSGQCIQPDRFAQALSAIGSLRLQDPKQEALRQRIAGRLTGLKCRLAQG